MADSKFSEQARELAEQAAAAAGPLRERATQLANQAAAAAGPLAAQAREFAGQAAAAAAPILEQARVRAAQGVDVAAGSLDKATGGKYSERIHVVASRVEDALETAPKASTTADPTLRAETAPLPPEPTDLPNDPQP